MGIVKSKKIILYSLLALILILVFIGIFIYIKNENMVAVLGYHSIKPKSSNNLIMEVSNFEEQLKTLKRFGYKTLTLDEFLCWKEGKCDKPHKSVLITFDDGYYDNYEYAFELLKKYDMNAVVFYIGKNYNTTKSDRTFMNLDDIKDSKNKYPNIEFASHTFDLHNNDDKNYSVVDDDIKKMKEIIDSKFLAYPHGKYNQEYIDALKDNGYSMAFTFGPGDKHRKAKKDDNNYEIPRLNISNDMPILKFMLRIILPL